MSHAKNKVDWCLRKAEKELKNSDKHRGLVKVKPDLKKSQEYLKKADHYLKATIYLKEGNFSDISASTVFYSMYHCLLAIAAKFGYESGNQECTFALINSLIDDKKIKFDRELLEKISSFEAKEPGKHTSIDVREELQYGTKLSMEEGLYKNLFDLAKEVISETKNIVEE